QRHHWNRLVSLIGWSALPSHPGEACYTDGSLTLRFVEVEGAAPSGLILELRVPSPEATARALKAAGLREAEGAEGVWADPAGHRLRLSVAPGTGGADPQQP